MGQARAAAKHTCNHCTPPLGGRHSPPLPCSPLRTRTPPAPAPPPPLSDAHLFRGVQEVLGHPLGHIVLLPLAQHIALERQREAAAPLVPHFRPQLEVGRQAPAGARGAAERRRVPGFVSCVGASGGARGGGGKGQRAKGGGRWLAGAGAHRSCLTGTAYSAGASMMRSDTLVGASPLYSSDSSLR